MKVANFMIHPNNGVPKFWAELMDGSCIFGSLVKKGIKRSANGGDPGEKYRKGYIDIPLGSLVVEDNHVEVAVQLATAVIPMSIKPGLITQALIQAILDEELKRGDNLSGLNLARANWLAPQPVAAPIQTFGPPKGKTASAFAKDYNPNEELYSF